MKLDELLKLSPEELFLFVKKNIIYGFVDKDNNTYTEFENVNSLYILQSPMSLLKSLHGDCWDIVELYRYYFTTHNIENHTYYMEYKDDDNDIHHTHTFLIFYNERIKRWSYILDNTSPDDDAFWNYDSLEEAIYKISNDYNQFIKNTYKEKYSKKYFSVIEYSLPEYNISATEFQKHIKK